MPLPTPILDDRSYQQLRDELVRRIPVYNPEWTDHNPSDPGITLVELFAFLGENILYRFNQIPESTKLAFLRLLQIPLRAATSATSIVSIVDPTPNVAAPPPLVSLGSVARAGDVVFETQTEVTVAPWRFVAVARTQVTRPNAKTAPEEAEFALAAIDARGGLKEGETALYYRADPLPLDPAAPGAMPVDFGATVDGLVWIAVLGDAAFLANLADETLNVGFIPDEQILPTDPLTPCPGTIDMIPRADPCQPAAAADALRQVVWEISTGAFDAAGEPIFKPLVVRGDTTRGMTQKGVVRLAIPHDVTKIGVFTVTDPDLQGTGSLPPMLDDPKDAASTIFWLRAHHVSADHRFGRVLWIGPNAAEVTQAKKAPTEFLGTGNGQAAQAYSLVNRPVIDGSLVVEVEDQPGVWIRWSQTTGFEASAEDDKHYTVDLEAGFVRFGNGVNGLAPQIGQRIRAIEYRYGGGPQGNVAAKAIGKLEAYGTLKVANPLAARGGAPVEPIASALERLPSELRRHDRAVTASDFRELALATPGADLGRADCIPLFDPTTGTSDAAGVVTVVVWPREDAQHPSAPVPDRTTLRTVCSWLDQKRLVTTELYVVPPTYREIAVAIGIHVKAGYGVDAVRNWVELVVRQYLAPLPPYGPDGQGWPLGRPVLGPEIEAAALQVEGVEYIDEGGVAVAALEPDPADKTKKRWVTGTVQLLRNEVPELSIITVVAGPRMDPGVDFAPPPPPGLVVPVPTIRVEC